MITLTVGSERSPDSKERCCFCRIPTNLWTAITGRKEGQQVACCADCAARANPQDVPTKAEWCTRERIAHRPTVGEISQGRDQRYPAPTILQRNV